MININRYNIDVYNDGIFCGNANDYMQSYSFKDNTKQMDTGMFREIPHKIQFMLKEKII